MKKASDLIKDFYQNRRERNAAYSLSAFARDVGISVSVLSRTLNGKRPVSLKLGLQISAALDLPKNKHQALLAAILASSKSTAKISRKLREQLEHEVSSQQEQRSQATLEVDQFKAISQWYHLAILNLARLQGFTADPVIIGKRLGIESMEAKSALERLMDLGLLEKKGATYKRTKKSLFVKTKNSHLAVRKFHSQMIEKALQELKEDSAESFERRVINGTTLACSQTQLETIKEKITTFQQELIGYLINSPERPDSVYQINVQFFPLTRSFK